MTDTLRVSAKAREAAEALNLELGGPDSPQDGTDLTIDGITASAFARFERDVTASLIEALGAIAYPDQDLSAGLSWDGHIVCGSRKSIDAVKRALHVAASLGDANRELRSSLDEALEQARDQ